MVTLGGSGKYTDDGIRPLNLIFSENSLRNKEPELYMYF